MYTPPLLKEDRQDVLHSLISKNPFAALVTFNENGPCADHIPFVLHPELSVKGTLRGHVSKHNPVAQYVSENPDTLVIFQGPHAYITPSWYASKAEHGKVVPTWNYILVHAYGKLEIIRDEVWLMEHLKSLTLSHEKGLKKPWKPADAPEKFIHQQLKGIVGVELKIDRFEGKWKVSQNKNAADKAGVVSGLQALGTEDAVAMAELVSGDFRN